MAFKHGLSIGWGLLIAREDANVLYPSNGSIQQGVFR